MHSFTALIKNFLKPSLFSSKLFCSIVTLAIGGCSDKSIQEKEVPLVVVTTTHLSDLVHSLAGDGGELFSDALGPPGESVVGPNGRIFGLDSWGGMMVHNVTTIVEALGKTD